MHVIWILHVDPHRIGAMGLAFVDIEEAGDRDLDGGPTEILIEAPFREEEPTCAEADNMQRQPVLSFVSLNERTAATVDFAWSTLASFAVDGISFGRGETNSVILQDPRVSLRHFTIRLQGIDRGKTKSPQTCSEAEDVGSAGSCGHSKDFNPPRPDCGPTFHFSLQLADESTNGTWVNDQLVGKDRHVPLSSGDRIFVLPAARVGQQATVGYVVVMSPTPPALTPEHNLGRQLAADVRCRLCTEKPIHRCVTTVPCGHIFDLGCLIAWRHRSNRCPECGLIVVQIVRNRGVDSVAETFLRTHPEAARSPSTLKLLACVEHNPESQVLLSLLLAGIPTPARSSAVLAAEQQRLAALGLAAWAPAAGQAAGARRAEAEPELPPHLRHLAPFAREAAAAAPPASAALPAAALPAASGGPPRPLAAREPRARSFSCAIS